MLGVEIEPIAFLLGMISSLFLASPSIAEFIIPDRKAVKDMNYHEILDFILETSPKKDWKRISTGISTECFLKEDPRLRFRATHSDQGVQNSDFKAEWANKHPDSHATGYWHDLYYDGNFIKRFLLVAIDGARTEVPAPEPNSTEIEPLKYKVAQIFDASNTLDEYIRFSGLRVKGM